MCRSFVTTVATPRKKPGREEPSAVADERLERGDQRLLVVRLHVLREHVLVHLAVKELARELPTMNSLVSPLPGRRASCLKSIKGGLFAPYAFLSACTPSLVSRGLSGVFSSRPASSSKFIRLSIDRRPCASKAFGNDCL